FENNNFFSNCYFLAFAYGRTFPMIYRNFFPFIGSIQKRHSNNLIGLSWASFNKRLAFGNNLRYFCFVYFLRRGSLGKTFYRKKEEKENKNTKKIYYIIKHR